MGNSPVSASSTADFLAPQTLQRPFEFYAAARRDAPVHKLPKSPIEQGDVWLVCAYSLIQQVLRDWRTYSNRFGHLMGRGGTAADAEVAAIEAQGYPQVNTMLTEDPPAQRRFRGLVTKAFGMTRVARMGAYIESICDELIDEFIDDGECDFFGDFAVPLPIYIIADQIGVPRSDLPLLKRISDDVVAGLGRMKGREGTLRSARARVELQHYFAAVIEQVRRVPRDNIISELANTRMENGELLAMPEALSILQQILVAGNETTTNAIAGGLVYLMEHPGTAERLHADPALIPNAVEEILRLESPTKHMWRIVTCDTELGGFRLPAGATLLLSYDAANRDEAVFADAETCRFDRQNADKHLSFGGGIHACVGAQLARKEMTIAYQRLFARLTHVRLADGHAPLRYIESILHRGLTGLRIRFDPRT
jgi:cytochrome P450